MQMCVFSLQEWRDELVADRAADAHFFRLTTEEMRRPGTAAMGVCYCLLGGSDSRAHSCSAADKVSGSSGSWSLVLKTGRISLVFWTAGGIHLPTWADLQL